MKRKDYAFYTLLFLAFSNNVFSQEANPNETTPPTEFIVNTEQQLTDFIVISCEGKAKEELYKKVVEWINKTYNKPNEVIKAQVENDYIRFQGLESKGYCRKPMVLICEDIRYEIEISVKDGKYKFDVVKLESAETSKYGNIIGWSEITFKKGWMNFKSNGEVRDQYKDTMPKIARYINSLNQSLYDYIYNQNQTAKQNDW